MKVHVLVLLAALSFAKCEDVNRTPIEPSSQLLSLEELQSMISSLEERKRQLSQHNNTRAVQRRLEIGGVQKATCSFDIIGVVLATARVGTVLYFVQDSCKTQETINQKTACSATISGLFSTIGFLISFLSDSISACSETVSLPATCAAVSGNIIAATCLHSGEASKVLGIMGGAISSMENSCRAVTKANEEPEWLQYVEDPPKWLKYVDRRFDRRLSGEPVKPGLELPPMDVAKLPAPPIRSILSEEQIQEIRNKLSAAEFRNVEISQCVFDTMLTAMFFGRGLLDIYNAAMNSPCEIADNFEEEVEQRVSCMISVSGMVTTFDYVAALLALITSECPEGANIKALCASDAMILVGVVSALYLHWPPPS
eukprot:Skav236382  [mRNA]  locus=scaffold29:4149:14092:- [translate_table: standard]